MLNKAQILLLIISLLVNIDSSFSQSSVGMPGISESHTNFLDKMVSTQQNGEDSVCLEQNEDGSCKTSIKKFIYNKKMLEESLRALAYLIRTVYIAPENRGKSKHYPFSDKTIQYGDHRQYSQCLAFGGAESDIAKISAGMELLNQIDTIAELHLRQQLRNSHYCSELAKSEENLVPNLREKYLAKNDTGAYIVPDCASKQEDLLKEQIQMLANQLYVTGTVEQALEGMANLIDATIGQASNNLAYRNTVMSLNFIPPDLFGVDPNFSQEPLKLTMAMDRIQSPVTTDAFAKRFYCAPVKIGIRNDERGEDFWKDFIKEIWNRRGIALDLAIEEVSSELLSYYDGDKQNVYPSNSNYSNSDNKSRFFEYLTDKDIWVLHQTDEFKNVCKDKYQNYLIGPLNVPDKPETENDYAVVGHEPLNETANPGFTVDGLIFENRERYLVKKLKTMTDEELIEFRKEFNLDNATSHINSAYYSAFTLYKRFLRYKQIVPTCDENFQSSCRLKQVLTYLDEVGYDIDRDRYQRIDDKEINDVEFKNAKGYRDLVNFLLPGGTPACYDLLKAKKNEYQQLWANNRSQLNIQTQDAYELQQEIYGLKRRLHKLLDDRIEFSNSNPESYLLSIYTTPNQSVPAATHFTDKSIFDVSDFTEYATNELMAPPPYASTLSGTEYAKYFSQAELENPISYHGLLSAAIAWIQADFYGDVTDDFPHDTSRLKFYFNLREMLGDYRGLVKQYSEQLAQDLIQAANMEEAVSQPSESGGSLELGSAGNNGPQTASPELGQEASAPSAIAAATNSTDSFSLQGLGINIGSSSGALALQTAAPFVSANLRQSISGIALGTVSGQLKAVGRKMNDNDLKGIKSKLIGAKVTKVGTEVESGTFTEKFLALKSSIGNKLATSSLFSKTASSSLISNFKSLDASKQIEEVKVASPTSVINDSDDSKKTDDFLSPVTSSFKRKSASAEDIDFQANHQILDAIKKEQALFTPKPGDSLFQILTKRYFITAYPKLLRRKNTP